MLKRTYRAMTPEERAQLSGPSTKTAGMPVTFWLSILFLVDCAMWCATGHKGQGASLFFAVWAVVMVGIAALEWRWRRRSIHPLRVWLDSLFYSPGLRDTLKRGRAAIQQDLSEGKMEVLHVEASDAAEIEEIEDLGLNFFLDLGDGNLLFLSGQYLYELAYEIDKHEVERPGKFPNRQIQITRAPHSRRMFDVTCLGEPFRPSRRYRVPKKQQRRFCQLALEDGQLIPGSVPTLPQDLAKLGIQLEPVPHHDG